MPSIKMYTTGYCPYCTRAKQFLQAKGVAQIEEIRIDTHAAGRIVMMDRADFTKRMKKVIEHAKEPIRGTNETD